MKFGKLLSLILSVLLSVNAFAALVQPDAATNVARNFIYEQYVSKGLNINLGEIHSQLLKVRESQGLPAYYVFNFSTGGWVIVSAEDAFSPIIGYSPEGNFPEEPGQNMASFLQDYVDQIDFIRINSIQADIETQSKWTTYSTFNNSRMLFEGERDIEPLIDILWDQNFPYNAYCPEDPAGPGGHVYAGCVATAMSMIMYYYRYPEVGTGSSSYNAAGYGVQTANYGETYYNWDAMQNTLTGTMGSCVNAIAELQYHCGVSVEMQYGAGGSGAYSMDVPSAIKSHFGYSLSAVYNQKMSYTATVWENMLLEQLNASKPVYYSGQSSEGGHAFVCDGFQQTGTGKLFHFNFGWSGYENGYFSLTDVNGYSSQQAMVRNFFPNTANYPYYCGDHTVTVPIGSFEDGSGPLNNYESSSTCSWLIAPTDSVSSITLTFTEMLLASGDSVKIYDGSNESAPLLAAYGMNSALAELTSSGCTMYITLSSDGAEEAEGFRAEFTSTFPTFCTNTTVTLTEPVGDLSDGSLGHNYNNNTICKWKINPGPYAEDLTLAFTSFDLEDGKDYLKVYAIPTNQLLASLTGSEIPEPIVSPTGQFMLMFSTNGYNNGQGFEAEYYISNVGTTSEDITQNLSIYPNPASSYTEVKFNVVEAADIWISMHNLLGEEVYAEPKQRVTGFTTRRIQLNGLSKGIYLLKINSDNGSVTRKIVVN